MSDMEICQLAYEGQFDSLRNKVEEDMNQIHKTDSSGRIPLHWAISGGKVDIISYLLQQGSDINARDDSKWTPLMIASSVGRADIVSALIEKGAVVNAVNETGQCALHYAASKEKYEIAVILLENGADLNIGDHIRSTPLHRAASKGNTKIVKLFLRYKDKLQLDPQDCVGNTPLHLACEEDRGEDAQLLIEAGASLHILNKEKKTPLDVAPSNLKKSLQKFLK